jgi:uncharacterized protein (TIGR00299 family) protein
MPASVPVSKLLYLDSVAGIAGDMFAAAFVNAGLVTAAELAALPAQLGFDGVKVELTSVNRSSIRATHLRVVAPGESADAPWGHSHDSANPAAAGHVHESSETHLIVDAPARHHHTHYVDIDRRLAGARIDPVVSKLARKIFRLLAEAEAAAHGTALEAVAFHEIGSIDSIVDVTMAAYCVARVQPVRCVASPIKPGRGFARMAHGTQPIPPPASAHLLQGLAVAATPAAISRENIELSTPTGIAILKALDVDFARELPAGRVVQQGLGGGTMDLPGFPNVFRIVLLETESAATALPYESDRVMEICATIDDDTGEHLAWLAERLLAAGALDVALLPGTGKKGRPLTVLSVLAPIADWPRHADWLLKNSTTFGLRYHEWDRLKLVRRFEGGTSDAPEFKVGLTTDGTELKRKAEFESSRGKLEWRGRD